jgi:aspartate racemase
VKTIGILGGMGPLATVDLFEKIVRYTDAGCDKEHIHILVDNNPSIPDRTEHILGRGESPLSELIRSALRLELMGADLIVMPCNTAHYYYNDIVPFLHVPFLNMIEETAQEFLNSHPAVKNAGLLATLGTYAAGIYDEVFKRYGINLQKPSSDDQKKIADIIYKVKGDAIADSDSGYFREVLERLKQQGSQIFVLGCTEIPIAWRIFGLKEEYIDPTAVLAKNAIRMIGKNIKYSIIE